MTNLRSIFYKQVNKISGANVFIDGTAKISFAGFGVLGLQHSREYRLAAHRAIEKMGTHIGSARVFYEDSEVRKLENSISSNISDACFVFPSATLAHLTLIQIYKSLGYSFIVTRQAHMSIRQAIRLSNVARNQVMIIDRCPSDNVLKLAIDSLKGPRKWLFCCDSIYGDGVMEDIGRVGVQVRALGGRMYVDDSHATGAYGRGDGFAQIVMSCSLENVVVGTFAKALGAYGAFALMSVEMRERVISRPSATLFTGPLPSAVLAQALSGWRISQSSRGALLRNKLYRNCQLFAEMCGRRWHGSHIFFFRSADPFIAFLHILERGFVVNPFIFPAVERRSEGLRAVVSALHSKQMLISFSRALATLPSSRKSYSM